VPVTRTHAPTGGSTCAESGLAVELWEAERAKTNAARYVRVLMLASAVLLAVAALGYAVWTPGLDVTDGRHDRGRNGIWIQHGWLGSDEWFRREHKRDRMADFRDPVKIRRLANLLREQHITDVFAHVSPADSDGDLPGVDHAQVERFLDAFAGFQVMPWTGGVQEKTCRIRDAKWRRRFVQSVVSLLVRHPRFAGVHINIEPCGSGSEHFLKLLDGLRQALPDRWLLSVAAYPPPFWWQPFPEVHWDETYFREVARRADQLAVMMYDTALPWPRPYQQVMRRWTREVIASTDHASILLGVPTYGDAGVGYHSPKVENLANALLGIHAGLDAYSTLPERYQGVAIYCEWETGEAEWRYWREHFVRRSRGGQ
jgi:hypothetical protein